jgi:hypothetical protein
MPRNSSEVRRLKALKKAGKALAAKLATLAEGSRTAHELRAALAESEKQIAVLHDMVRATHPRANPSGDADDGLTRIARWRRSNRSPEDYAHLQKFG